MSKCAYILLISIVTLGSCKVKWDFEVEDFEPKIVVDGWIESGNGRLRVPFPNPPA